FSIGSFSVPTVAIKAGIQPLLERELRQSSELNINESIIRYELGARTGSKLNLFYTAISRNLIEEIHDVCDSARVLPISIQPAFTGLIHLIKHLKTDTSHPTVIIHIDEYATTAGIFKNNGLLQLQLIPVGLKNLVERLSEDLNIPIEEANSIVFNKLIILEDPSSEAQLEIVEYTILESVFADLLQKIYGFLLLFSNDHSEEAGFSRIVISGPGSGIKNIDRLINANLGITTGSMSSETFVESIPFTNQEEFNVFAPVIGHALIQPWKNEGFERVFAA
ncbi:MAG: cell division protein FtsA, partial [Candidatus Riflebacteria bacterium]